MNAFHAHAATSAASRLEPFDIAPGYEHCRAGAVIEFWEDAECAGDKI
jgi:hypothetical protein